MAIHEPQGFGDTHEHLQSLLERARIIKPSSSVEPPLPVGEFAGSKGLKSSATENEKPNFYAWAELAARRVFHQFVSSTELHEPDFVNIWNLLDILSICGDQEQCDPVLVWWLIEELLESQSIENCRTVLDYLDSRRERLVARQFTGKKELVVLRAFNELLRRLSRAEDAVFCGRVLIFLSQSFQLGSRSATNHKGEFNLENVTTFEDTSPAPTEDIELPDAPPAEVDDATNVTNEPPKSPVSTSVEDEQSKKAQSPPTIDSDVLYPMFWSLQKAFSNPPLIFESEQMDYFKNGLDSTLRKFKEVPKVIETSHAESKKGARTGDGMESPDDFASAFNAKYLTSKDLFKLELSDLAFQRDILVQALILIDFLLSLSDKAKKKWASIPTPNKTVQYSFALTEQDEEWLGKMKGSISIYLREGPEGTYFYRMVDTVLSRDKNWVRWKLNNCPDIRREPISLKEHQGAKTSTKKLCASRRLRSAPMGSLDLSFLVDHRSGHGLKRLQESTNPGRFSQPRLETLVNQVQTTELDLEMASEEEHERLTVRKETQLWGVYRDAVRSRVAMPKTAKAVSANELRQLVLGEEGGKADGDSVMAESVTEVEGGGKVDFVAPADAPTS